METRLVNARVVALAADGSSLLVALGGMDAPVGQLWSIPQPAGEPRQLGYTRSASCGFLP